MAINLPMDTMMEYGFALKVMPMMFGMLGGDGNGLKDLVDSVKQTNDSVAALATKVGEVNDSVEKQGKRLDDIETKLEKLQTWSSDHNNRLKKLEAE